MGFSNTIKQQALVAAARHCCVCHRYKGLKIEVHHIEPEAEGGSNTFENAIPLCFDCHADAGHYNINHPKGTKFSKAELILARDIWYQRVKDHNITAQANTSEHLHFRHLMLRTYDLAEDIFSGDLTNFPFQPCLLTRNNIFKSVTSLLKSNERKNPVRSIVYRYFRSKKEVEQTYPDSTVVDKSADEFPYFAYTRVPSPKELREVYDQLDSFMRSLVDRNVETSKYVVSVTYENKGCGSGPEEGDKYIELFLFKPFWFGFLTITNTSQKAVELTTLNGLMDETNALADRSDRTNEVSTKLSFPKVAISPQDTIVVPTSIILVPFSEEEFDETILLSNWPEDSACSYQLAHWIKKAGDTNFYFLGQYFVPEEIEYIADDREQHSLVHDLDMNSIFVYDRFWHMGCCPHLFFYDGVKLYYAQEIFYRTPGVDNDETLIIPEGITKIIIAELEDEVTIITQISQNGKTTFSNVTLQKGEIFEMPVSSGDKIIISGRYEMLGEINVEDEGQKALLKNNLIRRFLKGHPSVLEK